MKIQTGAHQRRPGRSAGSLLSCGGRWILMLSLLAATGSSTLSADVRNVRVSVHEEFVRLVFETDNPAVAGQPVLDSQTMVLLPLPHAKVRTDAAGFWKPFPGIASLRFYEWDSMTVVRISTRFPVKEMRVLTLVDPHRVLLDLFFARSDAGSISDLGDPSGEETVPTSGEPANQGSVDPARATEASSLPLEDWIVTGDSQYQTALILLLVLTSLGAFASVVLTLVRGRSWSKPRERTVSSRDPRVDLAQLDSIILSEMHRYEELSGMERSR